MRALPVIAAALLVCSAVVGATGGLPTSVVGSAAATADDPTGVSSPLPERDAPPPAALPPAVAQTSGQAGRQQINVLDVPPGSVERWGVEEQYVDLGPALGLSTNATTNRLRTLAMVERVEAANTTADRRDRLRTALIDLERQVDQLDERQTAAVAAYGRGELSARELLVSLVRVSIAAEELNDRRSRIEALAADTRGFDINRGRLASIGNRLSAFTGPVRAHAQTVLRGEAAPHRFYIATGPQSVTVTTILDDTYIRESYRGDLRNGEGDAIELEVALDIVSSSYPVIWNTTREQTQVFGGGETYPVRIAHSRGDLTAFVDSNARVVYAEHQRRPLASMVADQRVERAGENIRVVVNQTYPGGPSQIRVVDDEGEPVDAAISLAVETGTPRQLGTTGDDGVLWTLSPYRQYTVTVDGRGESVDVVVDPGAPPRVKAQAETGDTGGENGNETATNGTATPNGTVTPTPTPTSAALADVYHR
ncbi:DUF7096 domain-containing protein [Haloplanus aerogenes]|uniref:Uncharacterized protein n=1 Tax=Haloplanus aerogenes TaxID=660522 RepID=A0A3M0DQ72_9EURY|nr:hypothetical protein [Haloplanus aerogenes]AZH24452.1 hypothetical protein DU502_03235 [Haloplanus aerogenes]RMB23901.1 hypothetical protein ATH50_1131 [Haloplanus aerogenes]